ncbi:MAG: hypothetical protein ACRDPF_34315 [Streptosporangiaceae bacterium]
MAQLTSIHPDQAIDATPAAKPAPSADLVRIKYVAWLIIASFFLLGIVFGVAVSDFSTASDVTAVVGSVTTVVGTIIGAFFGVQAGAAGKEAAEAGRTKAEAGRAQAENAARVALAHLDPAAATEVMKLL